MNTKHTPHTPGPWTISPSGTCVGSEASGPVATICTGGEILPAEEQANARLIGAAPELLAALESVVALATDPAGSTLKLREFLQQHEGKAVIAAIAKATQG